MKQTMMRYSRITCKERYLLAISFMLGVFQHHVTDYSLQTSRWKLMLSKIVVILQSCEHAYFTFSQLYLCSFLRPTLNFTSIVFHSVSLLLSFI